MIRMATTTGVNFRSGPGTAYPVLHVLARNTVVEVIDQDKGWTEVRAMNYHGYISSPYLVYHSGWRAAKSLDTLRRQIDKRWPKRRTKFDGIIGDAAHASRQSDHNPNVQGIVLAEDITHDPLQGPDAQEVVDALVQSKDNRISYLIHNGRIWRAYAKPGIPAWTPSPYRLADKHLHHFHISVVRDPPLYDDERPWTIE